MAADACPVKQYAEDVGSGKILASKWVRLACSRHLKDLEDGPSRGLFFDHKTAMRAIEFFPKLLVLYEGEWDGKPFELMPFQKFIVGNLFGWKMADGFRRFRTAYIEMGKGGGKALALDTPIPTPNGWSTMEDLRPGDTVFDETGAVCTVTAATEVMVGRPCYRLAFSDGETIVADAGHLWRVASQRNGRKPGPRKDKDRKGGYALRTTGEIAETWRMPESTSAHPQAKYCHRVDLAGPLDLPDAELSIPPYTLGAWLGDGDSDCARVTCGYADIGVIEQIKADGIPIKEQHRHSETTGRFSLSDGSKGGSVKARAGTMGARLRAVGLFKKKRIPLAYLRASAQQRLALMQGLMDTDGSVSKTGQVEFSSKWSGLAEDVAELARSLGFKAVVGDNPATLNGREVGRRYRLRFCPTSDTPVFRLPRKLARQKARTTTHAISNGRRIVGVERVESVAVRCIQVDAPSGMFLCGRTMIPTHNSPLAAGVGLYGLVMDDEPGAEIYSAATTRDQAGILFRDAKAFVDGSPALLRRLTVDKNNIAYTEKNSYFRPVSSEHRGLDGKRPHMALIDEIHEHPTALVVDKMRAGTKGRRNGLILEITNSGYDRHSVCYAHHEFSEKVLEGVIANDSWFAYVAGLDVCEKCAADGKTIPVDDCPDCDSWKDETKWIKANPGLDVIIPRKYLREQIAEASEMPSKENIVKRLNCCIWTESVTKWLSLEKWNACGDAVDPEALKGRTCYGGLDLSSTTDITAWVLVFPPEKIGGKYSVLCRFFIPEDNMRERSRRDHVPYDVWSRQGFITATPGNVIDYKYVLDQIRKDSEDYDVAELAFDRWGSQKIITDLQDIGFEVEGKKSLVQFGQGFASMSSPTKELEKMVLSGEIAHGNQPVLSWMVSNTVVRSDPAGNLKPDREKSTEKIDGVVSLIMGIARAMLKNETISCYESRGVLTF